MNSFMDIVILILYALLSYWVSAVIHELGHVIVGLLHGWKLFMIVVGPFGVKRKEEKLSFYFEKNIILWGGVGGTLPVKNDVDNTKIWAKILLGGPAASILTGCIFLIICFIHFNFFLLLLGLMPISMGIACLLPLKTGITYSDGKRWQRLHDNGKGQAEEIALFKMIEFEQLGKDKTLIKKDDFEALLEAELPALRYYGYYYLYKYYENQNDFDNKLKAFDILNDLKKDVPKIIIDDCKL